LIYTFEDYSLDGDRQELRRGADLVPVEPQVFDLLQYLVRNRGHVVGRDELIEAVWGGRFISDSTISSRITAVRHAIRDSGKKQRLIRTIVSKGFRFISEVTEEQTSGNDVSALGDAIEQKLAMKQAHNAKALLVLAMPDKPSIAVLPFQNMSGDPEQEYFADGMVEEIITALSRMRSLFVIARNSSFTYKGRAVDVKQVGRDLGVRYVLEGSVRKAANRVRVTAQLVDVSNAAHLWADRFEGAIEDIFELQDQITASVVGALTPKLEQAEIERATRKPTESLDAYDYYLRAMVHFYLRKPEANDEALRLFYKAIELDSNFALPYGMAAWCYVWRKMNGWMTDRAQEIAEGTRLAQRAVELGKDEAVALARGGHALAFLCHDLDSGVTFLGRALLLNPNLALAWYLSGWVRAYYGEPEVAIEHLARAMRLSPLDPYLYHMQVGTAFAHLLAGRFDEASSWANGPFREQPNFLPAAAVTAASQAHAGRMKEARLAIKRLRQISPALRVSNLKDLWPFRRPEDFATWADGLQKAGLPH
jgi:TolB-like protein